MSKLGLPSQPKGDKRSRWIQTEASSHEAWAHMTIKTPKSAALMHLLCSRMDRNSNAVVASHKTLAKLMSCCVKSVKKYINQLEKDRWVQVVSLGSGSANAYVINSLVGWSQSRDNLQYSQFTAQVIADADDQLNGILNDNLRKIPVLFDGDEIQLPSGKGEEPPAQQLLEGFEPDLPTVSGD
jgi:hypothetical protein